MQIKTLLILAVATFLCFGSVSNTYAATRKKVICNKNGALLVRLRKCRSGESRVNLADLVQQSAASIPSIQGPQGPTGPKGATGATGPQGDPAGFDVTACYHRQTTTGAGSSVGANAPNSRSLNCDNPTTDFMLTSSFHVNPVGVSSNKPFIQSKILELDATGTYPIGVTYNFLQSVSGGFSYGTYVHIICCPK